MSLRGCDDFRGKTLSAKVRQVRISSWDDVNQFWAVPMPLMPLDEDVKTVMKIEKDLNERLDKMFSSRWSPEEVSVDDLIAVKVMTLLVVIPLIFSGFCRSKVQEGDGSAPG